MVRLAFGQKNPVSAASARESKVDALQASNGSLLYSTPVSELYLILRSSKVPMLKGVEVVSVDELKVVRVLGLMKPMRKSYSLIFSPSYRKSS